MRLRAGRRTAAVSVAVLLSAGCASVPDDGPVQRAEAGAAAQQTSEVRVLPASPRPGAAADGIVRGFLAAGAAFENDYAIARKYLTEKASERWRPRQRILVHSDPYGDVESADGRQADPQRSVARFKVVTEPTAVVDSLGTYQETAGGAQTLRFVLVKERGEWRIDALPDGVLLARSDLERTFRLRDVFFLDRGLGVVVSDVVLMPDGPAMADALVRRLLDGPSQLLGPDVITAATDGMTLAAPVTVDARGLASVDLEGIPPTTGEQREALSAQVVWTLRQVPEVQSIRIRLQGRPLDAGSVAEVVRRDSWPGFDPAVLSGEVDQFAIREDRVGRLVGDKHTPLANDAGDGDLVLQEFAVDIDRNELAGVEARTGRVLVGPLDSAGAFRTVQGLPKGRWIEPSYDRLNTLWITDAGTGTVYAVQTRDGGSVKSLLVPPLDGTLTRLRIARDGIRFAAVAAVGGGTSRLYVGTIARTPTERPRVMSLRVVKTTQQTIGDLAWVDHRRIALLPSGLGRTPLLVDIAGFEEERLPLLSQGISITAAPGPESPPMVATKEGILRLDGRTWEEAGTGRAPAYPG